jgi:pimeloyl-ACP methyl ester carboxylesterase
MAHGFTGVRDMRLDGPAERFVAAGYAVVVFDYRHFGDSSGEPRQLMSVRRQYADWDAAIAYVRDVMHVDPGRIVLWGTSFSGGHVIDAAVRYDVAAAILQAPFTDGLSHALGTDPRLVPRLVLDGVRDQIRGWTRRSPRYVPVACPPGGYAVLSAAHVWEAIPVVVPEGSTWRNEVAARVTLRMPMHRPGRHAGKIRCPVLVQVLEDETVLGVRPAKRAAARAPRGELLTYSGLDHFDVYVGDGFERLNADQLDFLARHVPTNVARWPPSDG